MFIVGFFFGLIESIICCLCFWGEWADDLPPWLIRCSSSSLMGLSWFFIDTRFSPSILRLPDRLFEVPGDKKPLTSMVLVGLPIALWADKCIWEEIGLTPLNRGLYLELLTLLESSSKGLGSLIGSIDMVVNLSARDGVGSFFCYSDWKLWTDIFVDSQPTLIIIL